MRISKSDVDIFYYIHIRLLHPNTRPLKCSHHARFRKINGKAIWETCGTKLISVYIKEKCVTKSLLKSIPEEEYTGQPKGGGATCPGLQPTKGIPKIEHAR